MELDPTQIYYWQLEWEWGVVTGLTQAKLLREDRVDPQNPPARYGRVRRVSLIPLDLTYPKLSVDVPVGASPICHRRVTRENFGAGSTIALLYRIGYRIGKTRTMRAVDLFTRKIIDIEDEG